MEKLVLKIPLSTSHSNGESIFLKAWEATGISVPHVLENGTLGSHQYLLMEYIDAPIASSAFTREELAENKIYFQMGQILRKMNSIPADGYGLVVDGKPEFGNFVDWARSPDMQTRYDYVKGHKILGDKHGSVDRAIEILIDHTNKEKSTYCHNDFGLSNLFATTPLTVFDPNPRFNNGYLDIACSIYNGIVQHYFAQEIIDGYFENEKFKPEVFHAAIMLTAYYKLPYAHKTKKEKAISYVQEYLLENKHLLD
jgi:fructosamine-3-kinase